MVFITKLTVVVVEAIYLLPMRVEIDLPILIYEDLSTDLEVSYFTKVIVVVDDFVIES